MAKRRTSRLTLAVALLLIPAGCTMLTRHVESLFFWPDRSPFDTPSGYEDVTFESGDGHTLHAWFMPAEGVDDRLAAPSFLFCHGNAGSLPAHEGFALALTQAGANVLMFDYRTYGRSEPPRGKPTRSEVLRDADAALDALLARDDIDPERVGVLGYSLGATVAVHLVAKRPQAKALILCAGFSSWTAVANDHAPIAGMVLAPKGLASKDAVARLGDRPLLIMHGTRDTIVRPYHAEILAESARAAGVDTALYLAEDADHIDLLDRGDTRDRLRAFVERVFPISDGGG